MKVNSETLSFLVAILFFQLSTDIAVALDVSFARQVLAFVYLLFIPGFVVLKALKWDKRHLIEVVLFSLGLSIALVMFVGLIIDLTLPVFGIIAPLTALNLLTAMNLIVILSCAVVAMRGVSAKNSFSVSGWRSLLFAVVPILAVSGALVVNNGGSNIILLAMLATVAGLITVAIISKKLIPPRFYPILILAIAVALVLHSSLSTNYILGYDINSEYYAFTQTSDASYWNPHFNSTDFRVTRGMSMLSSTIFPTVFAKITNIDPTWLMKILFSLVLSFVPLALYRLYSLKLKKEVAFLGASFVMCNLVFFGTEGFPTKQMVAELFFVLLFLVLLNDEIGGNEKTFLFIVFGASLVVSHYSMAYIFLFMIFATWALLYLMRYLKISSKISLAIPLTFVVFFSLITLGWYIFTISSTIFDSLVQVVGDVARNFIGDFLDPFSRSQTVLKGFGAVSAVSFAHQIGRIWFYLAELLIVLGVALSFFKKRFSKFGEEYSILTLISLSILISAIIIPNFASYFRMERFYQISTLFLAPFLVLGGLAVFNFITRRKHKVLALNLVLLVVIPFFLFESGFIYEVTRDVSYSIPLSRYRWDFNTKYEQVIDGKEVAAAVWLHNQTAPSDALIYADFTVLQKTLVGYGLSTGEITRELKNNTKFGNTTAYIFMREVNVIGGIMISQALPSWNVTDIEPFLINQNLIYSDRDNVVFYVQAATT